MNGPGILERVSRLPVRARVAFGAAVSELVSESLTPDVVGSRLARRAVTDIWRWVAGEDVTGDTLAEYVDGQPEMDLSTRVLECREGPEKYVLITVVEAVTYAALHAYEVEGNRSRSAPIWEVSEKTLEDVLHHAFAVSATLAPGLLKTIVRLEELFSGYDSKDLGLKFHRNQVMPGQV